jgi:glycosyltransferase involved in cell wall biosynthesis
MGQIITVSILMPIYKVDQFLEKALISVFTQTYKNIDYVFVIDGSPDNSMQILYNTIDNFCLEPDRYKVIIHESNEGIAKSRSDSIVMAKGDYVYFVDSDDWIEEDAVEQMVSATKDGSIDIVGCDYLKDFQSGKTVYHRENYGVTCIENLHRCINYDIATVLWKLLIRRQLFANFRISPINIGEDYIISIKLFYYAKSFVSLNKAFYHYVQYNQNRLSFQSLRSISDHIKCVKEVERFIKENGFFDDDIQHEILLRKFNIKSNFVLNNMLLDKYSYNNTFPEANGVWQEMGYSRKEKIKFWLAENGLFALLKLIQH